MYSLWIEIVGIVALIIALILLFMQFSTMQEQIHMMNVRINQLAAYRDEDMNELAHLERRVEKIESKRVRNTKNEK